MEKKISENYKAQAEPRKRLSLVRVAIALVLVGFIGYGSVIYWRTYEYTQIQVEDSARAWFAPYVDVTSTPTYSFEQLSANNTSNAILAFIVSSHDDPCTPTWGGAYTLEQAGTHLDLDRRIARFRQQGGDIAISFGGLTNDEIALFCTDDNELLSAYQSVIERYDIDTIDLDLEGEGLANHEAMIRRSEVIAQLQRQRKEAGKNLKVWLTLPVTTQGMTPDGTDTVSRFLSAGVDLAGVNAMTMNFGESRSSDQTMHEASEEALKETHRQLGILYKQAGIHLNNSSLWAKVAPTPMIGQNDLIDEVFSVEDAIGLNKFVSSVGINRVSMWSANRDVECSENYVNVAVVSDLCSGIEQERFIFAETLGDGLNSKITQASSTTVEDQIVNNSDPDNPDESPYQIWKESGTYLEGTKVVWRRNVYQAKWWTQGDFPDNPALQSWQTPWKLIGPVLPGEKLVPIPTLPPNTYPAWQGAASYDAGDRVLFNGIPYQAKWWTQGDSPAATTSNPDNSPWLLLTDEQIKKIQKEAN